MKQTGPVVYCLLLCFACGSSESIQIKNSTVAFVFFDNADTSLFSSLKKDVFKYYQCNAILLESVQLPANAYYKPRNRYRADSLLIYLKSLNTNQYRSVVGITDSDISVTVNRHKDWGVFGYGYCPGNSCVVSLKRLLRDNPNTLTLKNRLKNVVIHELGHNIGLPHCPSSTCIMKDAKAKLESIEGDDRSFCTDCKSKIQ